MKNKKKTITPSEINKFLYCPYQWYYERKYGQIHLKKLYKERNEKYNLKDNVSANFKKGIKFHETYMFKEKIKSITIKILLLIILLTMIYLYFKLGRV